MGQCGLVESVEYIFCVDEVARLVPWTECIVNLEIVERAMVIHVLQRLVFGKEVQSNAMFPFWDDGDFLWEVVDWD